MRHFTLADKPTVAIAAINVRRAMSALPPKADISRREAAMLYRRCRVPVGCAAVPVVAGVVDAEDAARPSEARTTTLAPSGVRW